jgi:hypothetical protein
MPGRLASASTPSCTILYPHNHTVIALSGEGVAESLPVTLVLEYAGDSADRHHMILQLGLNFTACICTRVLCLMS